MAICSFYLVFINTTIARHNFYVAFLSYNEQNISSPELHFGLGFAPDVYRDKDAFVSYTLML